MAVVVAQPAPTEVTQEHRERVWRELLVVGRPDSRFHWDFSSFIVRSAGVGPSPPKADVPLLPQADFEGSDAATERVRSLEAWKRADTVFITPDNSTELLRRAAVLDGKTQLVTTYGIRRGFYLLRPEWVPAHQEAYAATLDGLDKLGRPVSLAELKGGPPLALLVTGGSAVSRNGVRFGKGHGYFDLEWAMLSEVGLTDGATEVVDLVHDCQYVDEVLEGEPHDVAVDWIITPSRTLQVEVQRRPGRVFWDLLAGTEHEHLPPIEELRAWKLQAAGKP